MRDEQDPYRVTIKPPLLGVVIDLKRPGASVFFGALPASEAHSKILARPFFSRDVRVGKKRKDQNLFSNAFQPGFSVIKGSSVHCTNPGSIPYKVDCLGLSTRAEPERLSFFLDRRQQS